MATKPSTIRIPQETRRAIQEACRRTGRDFSSLANEMLAEAVRMRRIPGIVFPDSRPMLCYLDEDLSGRIAALAASRGFDVLSSHSCGRDRLDDETQLRLAAEEGRCFVTKNRDDFVALTVRFFETEWPHAGVLIVPSALARHHFTKIVVALEAYNHAHPDGLRPYAIDFLSHA